MTKYFLSLVHFSSYKGERVQVSYTHKYIVDFTNCLDMILKFLTNQCALIMFSSNNSRVIYYVTHEFFFTTDSVIY